MHWFITFGLLVPQALPFAAALPVALPPGNPSTGRHTAGSTSYAPSVLTPPFDVTPERLVQGQVYKFAHLAEIPTDAELEALATYPRSRPCTACSDPRCALAYFVRKANYAYSAIFGGSPYDAEVYPPTKSKDKGKRSEPPPAQSGNSYENATVNFNITLTLQNGTVIPWAEYSQPYGASGKEHHQKAFSPWYIVGIVVAAGALICIVSSIRRRRVPAATAAWLRADGWQQGSDGRWRNYHEGRRRSEEDGGWFWGGREGQEEGQIRVGEKDHDGEKGWDGSAYEGWDEKREEEEVSDVGDEGDEEDTTVITITRGIRRAEEFFEDSGRESEASGAEMTLGEELASFRAVVNLMEEIIVASGERKENGQTSGEDADTESMGGR